MIVVPQVCVTGDRVAFGDGDAVEVARTLVAQGARALQVRDADGSIAGAPRKAEWLGDLLAAVDVPVQFDGAAVDAQAIEQLAALPFDTIVIGQAAIFEPMLLRWAYDLLGERMVLEVNADGDYLFDPPRSGFAMELFDAVRQLRFQGARHILLRDVTGTELPLRRLRTICNDIAMGVTFSGLVRSVDDLRELRVVDSQNLRAVVVGEPLFDGRIRLSEANAAADVDSAD